MYRACKKSQWLTATEALLDRVLVTLPPCQVRNLEGRGSQIWPNLCNCNSLLCFHSSVHSSSRNNWRTMWIIFSQQSVKLCGASYVKVRNMSCPLFWKFEFRHCEASKACVLLLREQWRQLQKLRRVKHPCLWSSLQRQKYKVIYVYSFKRWIW